MMEGGVSSDYTFLLLTGPSALVAIFIAWGIAGVVGVRFVGCNGAPAGSRGGLIQENFLQAMTAIVVAALIGVFGGLIVAFLISDYVESDRLLNGITLIAALTADFILTGIRRGIRRVDIAKIVSERVGGQINSSLGTGSEGADTGE